MKLWLITRRQSNLGWEVYVAGVVAAPTAEAAKDMHPGNGQPLAANSFHGWVSDPADVLATFLGDAVKGTKQGVICASYTGA